MESKQAKLEWSSRFVFIMACVGGFLLSYVPAQIFDYLQYVGYAVITYIAYRIATTSLDTNKESSSHIFS